MLKQKCFVQSLIKRNPAVLNTIVEFRQCIVIIALASTLDLSFNNTWNYCVFHKDALCQGYIKLAQWFSKIRLLKFCECICVIISPRKKAWSFTLKKMTPWYPRVICAMFVEICVVVPEKKKMNYLNIFLSNSLLAFLGKERDLSFVFFFTYSN